MARKCGTPSTTKVVHLCGTKVVAKRQSWLVMFAVDPFGCIISQSDRYWANTLGQRRSVVLVRRSGSVKPVTSRKGDCAFTSNVGWLLGCETGNSPVDAGRRTEPARRDSRLQSCRICWSSDV